MKTCLQFFIDIYIILTIWISITLCQTEEDIDEFIATILNCTDVPGLSLTVVKDNQEILVKGYGVENIDTEEPVTKESLFLIASLTKAFAGTSAAIVLKNSNLTTWQTPIRDVLGEDFYLNDALRSQRANLNDLYAHRLGLPGHNTIRMAGYTLEELVSKLRFLEFAIDFRIGLLYNNIIYGLAEYVLQTLDGRPWKDIIREEIFKPLGMNSSTFVTDREAWPDCATAYYTDDQGQLREVSLEVPFAYYDNHEGSSGSIVSNAQDMSRWIQFQLNQGVTPDGMEILTPNEFRETHDEHIQTRLPSRYTRPEYPVTYKPPGGYSCGWFETTYKGLTMHQHEGSLGGYLSHLALLPDFGHGVFVSVNKSPDRGVRHMVVMRILDLLLGEEPWITTDNVCEILNNRTDSDVQDDFEKSFENSAYKSKSNTNPNSSKSRDFSKLEPYIGIYGNYAYGNATVEYDNTTGGLVLFYGEANHAWDLTDDFRNGTFTGQGREPFWYWNMPVNFEPDASAVTVWFSVENLPPPTFYRDLDLNTPPPPPELCSEL